MALEDVLAALAEHWDDVLSHLDAAARQQLTATVEQVVADPERSTDAALEIVTLLVHVLPVDHPVVRATRGGLRLAGRPAGGMPVPAPLRARLAALRPLGDQPDPERIWTAARRRLLAAPSVSAEQVLAQGVDPDLPDLIRLDRDDGTIQLPVFQFGARGAPLPLVLQINRTLDVFDDPWGVADWWLGQNAWLEQIPAQLIGVVDDRVLLATAACAVED
jgi:hypothetical protein